MFPSPRRARGFATSVIVAVFAMLAVLGTSLVVISTTQQGGAALDLEGARAYYAARGGAEWALNRLLLGGTTCATVNGSTFDYVGNLTGFRVVLACRSSIAPHVEAGGNVTMFVVTATACNDTNCPAAIPPSPTYVSRQVSVTVGSN
jgi:MSHA biogenesis protein MshP